MALKYFQILRLHYKIYFITPPPPYACIGISPYLVLSRRMSFMHHAGRCIRHRNLHALFRECACDVYAHRIDENLNKIQYTYSTPEHTFTKVRPQNTRSDGGRGDVN